jgi:hypothetical protein
MFFEVLMVPSFHSQWIKKKGVDEKEPMLQIMDKHKNWNT